MINILKVRLTDALLSSLDFKFGKNAEVAWLNARISAKGKKRQTKVEDKNREQKRSYFKNISFVFSFSIINCNKCSNLFSL